MRLEIRTNGAVLARVDSIRVLVGRSYEQTPTRAQMLGWLLLEAVKAWERKDAESGAYALTRKP